MSTAAPPVATAKPSTADQLIDQRIEEARRAIWWSELTRTGLKAVIGTMLALLAWLVMDHWIYSPGLVVRLLSFVALAAAVIWYVVQRAWPVMTSRVTSEYAAWALEQDHPDYRQQLTSYVTLKESDQQRGIRARVLRVIGVRAASILKANDRLPNEATGTFRWWIAAAAVFALLAAYCVASPKSSFASTIRLLNPLSSVAPAKRVKIREVQPGNLNTLAGRDVEVSAEIDGLLDGESVWCSWSGDGPSRQAEMSFDSNSDRYVGTIPLDHSASGLVRYTIEAGDAVAGPFNLSVENVPVVAIESVRYEPPAYTKRKQRTTSSPAITAIDGTKLRITAKTNRPVSKAELQFNVKRVGQSDRVTGGRVPIPVADDGVTLNADVVLRSARGRAAAVELENYRIRVWDPSNQTNPDPIIYPIKVIPDLPPEVAIVVPQKSPVEVPLGAQQIIEVHAMDADFELQQVSLKLERGLDTLGDPVVWIRSEGGSGKGNQVAEYRFRPLEHRLRPGDVVRVSATAIDNRSIPGDPKATPNETTTDQVELKIVEDEEELPEDPAGNDGLSKPDERPASDVKQSEQEQSGGQAGDQSGDGQGGQGGGTQGQGSGEEGTQGEGSAGQDSQNQGSEGQDSQSEGGGGDNQAQGGNENQGDSENQGGDSAGGESNADGNAGDSSSTNQGSDSQSQDSQGTGSQDTGSQGTGSEGIQPEGTEGATDTPSDQSGGGQNTADQNTAGQDSDGQSGEQSGCGDPSAEESMSSEGSNQNDGSGGQGNSERSGSEESGSQNSGQNDRQGSGGEQSKTPPKHDGEAMERIKDYIERQKQKQSQGSSGDSAQQDNAAGEGQTRQDESSPESPGSESSSGDKQASQEETKDGDTGSSEAEGGESGNNESQSPQGKQSGGEESGSDGQGDSADADFQSTGGDQGDSSTDRNSPDSTEPSSDKQGGEQSSSGESTQRPPSDSTESSDGESGTSEGSQSSRDSRSPQTGNPNQSSPQSSDTSSGGQGEAGGVESDADGGASEPPPPPDLEYAKEATDMVLDYLDETRDQVDQDLLDELDWSKEDLQRFRDRWEQVRQLEQPAADRQPNQEFEDALRSLGLEPGAKPGRNQSRNPDAIRNLRDSGNRRRAPAAIRDAFDAFRRRQ